MASQQNFHAVLSMIELEIDKFSKFYVPIRVRFRHFRLLMSASVSVSRQNVRVHFSLHDFIFMMSVSKKVSADLFVRVHRTQNLRLFW